MSQITQRENMELVFQHKMPEYIPHMGVDVYCITDEIVERSLFTTKDDAWGIPWISYPGTMGITMLDETVTQFEDLENWREQIRVPDLDKFDFTPVVETAKTFTDREKKMIQYITLNGVFERSHQLMGLQNALVAYMEDPEEYGELLKVITDHKIRLFKKMYDICQPDMIYLHDDIAIQTGQLMPNEFYTKYLFPQYKRLVNAAREMGYKYFVHHSCGRVDDIFAEWLDCGFDGWDSVMTCNNLPNIKERYGKRIVLSPALDNTGILGREGATRSEIEHMVVEWLEMLAGDGQGMVIDSSFLFSLNIPNEEICLEFVKKHSKPFMDAKRAGKAYIPDFE